MQNTGSLVLAYKPDIASVPARCITNAHISVAT